MQRTPIIISLVIALLGGLGYYLGQPTKNNVAHEASNKPNHLRAIYSPLHFMPAAANASDEQCLACHREVLEDKPRKTSPAGVASANSKAWYQQVSTYQGEQDTFHRRHLVTAMAKELMNLQCNTCHQGHDPREEAPGSSADRWQQSTTNFTLRKQVNPETVCLKCHGQMPLQNMGLTQPWPEMAKSGMTCISCHANIRTVRHQVNYLNAAAIEAAGSKNSEVCFGCHGGRPWYRISYPYPRHSWPNMPTEIPTWAKDRPISSEPRFIIKAEGK